MSKRIQPDLAVKDKIIADACTHFKIGEATLLGDLVKSSLITKIVMFAIYHDARLQHQATAELFSLSDHQCSHRAAIRIINIIRRREPEADIVLKFYREYGYCSYLWEGTVKKAA